MYLRLLQSALVTFCVAIGGCSSEEPSVFLNSGASYEELNSEVGCDSKYSDDKRDDIFNSQYKDHWMTLSGEVVLAEADNASLNIDGKGTQDLRVDFADKQAGYDLTKGNVITVKFVMKNAGGCFLPFSGDNASIVSTNAASAEATSSTEAALIEDSQPRIEQAIKQVDTAMQDPRKVRLMECIGVDPWKVKPAGWKPPTEEECSQLNQALDPAIKTPGNRCGKKYDPDTEMHGELMEKLATDAGYENGADKYFSAFVSELCKGTLNTAKQYVSNAEIPVKSAQFVTKYFGINIEFEMPSLQSKQIQDVRQELTNLGICQACAGNAAMYGVIEPNSECGSLVKNALNDDKDAIRKLEEFPAFCKWKF